MKLNTKAARNLLASAIVAVSMAAFGSATALADQSVNNVTISPGGTFCLATEFAQTTFAAAGYAFDVNFLPVTVKWSVWHGTYPNQADIKLFSTTNSSFTYNANGPGDYTQACIKNTSSITVLFFLQQVPR